MNEHAPRPVPQVHAGRPSHRIAVIIRRDLAPAAAYVRGELQAFVSLAAVIIDRRYGERRRTAIDHPADRRRADRRRHSIAPSLRDDGWAVVKMEESTPAA